MNKTNRNLAIAMTVLMTGGAAVFGGLAWGATQAEKPDQNERAPALNLTVDEQPIHRKGGVSSSFAPVVKQVMPSVVKISTVMKARLTSGEAEPRDFNVPPSLRRFFGDQFQWNTPNQPLHMPPQEGVGSGVIVTKDGYILTNNHVVDGADEVKVTLNDSREYTAKVIGRDPKTDVAVVKVKAEYLPALEIADSDHIEVGDVVLAIGNPFGIGTTVTTGIVSAKGRAPLGLDYEDFIQTDAAINPGNSGGALVDVEGRLIGINTAILSRSGGNQGIGFAIPSNLAREVMASLVQYGHVVRGFLGVTIQDVTPALAKEFKLADVRGALVADVSANSPASKAGFADGDIVVKFNGKEVADSRHLKLQVAEAKPNESVPVEILRNGEIRNLHVKVGELPGEKAMINAKLEKPTDSGTLNGVGVADLDAGMRRQFNLPDNVQGAVITSVAEDSASAGAGLKPGDVILEINRHKVANAEDAVRLTENAKDKRTLLRVWENGGSRYVVVDESNKAA